MGTEETPGVPRVAAALPSSPRFEPCEPPESLTPCPLISLSKERKFRLENWRDGGGLGSSPAPCRGQGRPPLRERSEADTGSLS